MTTVCVAFRELIANILIIMPIVPRVVAITGANAGIGEGIAHAYARDKASLVLIARNKERLEKVAEACKELGSPDVKIVQMDVSDTKAVADFFDEKTVEYGIELFIANAGVSTIPKTPLLDQMEKMFQINLLGALAGVNSVFKAMKKRGRGGQIAVVSSVFGFQVPPTLLNYGASKAALMSYCRDLRALGKDEGIKVNTIAPGYIATEMTAALPRRNKFFYLTPEKFGEQIKKGLEDDVAFISLPLHQYFLFSVSAALPISVRQWIAIAFHKTLDSIIKMNANTKEEKKII